MLTAALVIWVIVIILRFENVDIHFEQTGDTFLVEAAGYECEFTKEEIVEVTLLDRMPEDKFIRTNGGSTEDYDIGHFKGKETGKCMLFLDKESGPVLEIQLKDEKILLPEMRRKIQKAGMRCCPYKILILMAYTVKENKTVFSDKEDFIWKRLF